MRPKHFSLPVAALFLLAAVVACGGGAKEEAATPTGAGAGLTFESGPVRPLALSADGTRLFVANIPDGYLEIIRVTANGPVLEASVPVGVDPVAVAVRNDNEVWVVNHVSDSVSVVDVASVPPRVVRTLLVGDEPSDIVFAGPNKRRAFITTAHRGQQRVNPELAGVPGAGDPQLSTAGVGRADVWVFDAEQLGDALGSKPLAILTLRGDTPRPLAVTPDGATVYAGIFKSGNQTTVTSSVLPCVGFDNDTPCTVNGVQVPGSALGPATNHAGAPAPRVGVIVKGQVDGSWRDGRGRDWSSAIKFDLPDEDVFAIDAASLATTSVFRHVGTTLFNMVVNPRTSVVYVANTEARNDLRFEGPGTFSNGTTLQGHLAESRITVLDGASVKARHLNKHIPYATRPAPAGVKDHSLATPLDMAVSSDGATLYVAAFGSSKVGVLSTAALENDSFDPTTDSAAYISVTGGGPGGLALDDARQRLYVATRFDNGISVVDLTQGREVSHLKLHSPEPAAVIAGRRFLYDATTSSSNGEAACASCHMFGDTDHLAWDLGNPDGDVIKTPVNIRFGMAAKGTAVNGSGDITALHPMKGPMATQTMRGMVNSGAMHWRGDRVDGFFGRDTRSGPPFDSALSFKNFIVAFGGLLGRDTQFASNDMQAFADFALAVALPPNPVRSLDNSLTDAQARGKKYFMGCDGLDSETGLPARCDSNGKPIGAGHFGDGGPGAGFTCEGCHVLSPAAGFFGTDGQSSFEGKIPDQTMKIPHLRNLYTKVGMFSMVGEPEGGAQVRGFGFINDASVDSLSRFLKRNKNFDPSPDGLVGFTGGDPQRRDVEQFLLAFDSDLAPIVGQQITLDASNAAKVGPRIDLLRARAQTAFASKVLGPSVTECDLVVRGVVDGRMAAFALRRDGAYDPDDDGASISDSALRALAKVTGQALTFTCLPPGWGPRALHRDRTP